MPGVERKCRTGVRSLNASALIRIVPGYNRFNTEARMLRWAIIFLVIALIAAALGFSGIAAGASSIAQILFVVFLVLFVIAMVVRAVRGRPPV